MIKIKHCKLAQADHDESVRQYAHTFHKKNVICMCKELNALPNKHYWAIIAHEIGHLIAGHRGSEKTADKAANKFFGIKIYYTDSKYGKKLQTLSKKDIQTVAELVLL